MIAAQSVKLRHLQAGSRSITYTVKNLERFWSLRGASPKELQDLGIRP